MAVVLSQYVVDLSGQPQTVAEIMQILTNKVPVNLRAKDRYGNDTCIMAEGGVRVSTAVCFMDVHDRVLVWGRPADMQENINNGFDCYGAVAFNNASLSNKLTEEFVQSSVIEYKLCPGFAIEQSDKEVALMLVWIVIVPDAAIGEIPEKSFVMHISDLRSEICTKTAKLELAIANL